ncbi:MAG: phenylalanine--tRNA ligase subunit beta [Pseudomonadota bacterium]|nr:phenylalanine--tRNA ligase subunit beta [Pseudomonadota bacterium]
MKFSLTTLKQYLNTNATATELADKMTMLGLEVEEVQDLSASLKGYIVGEIRVVEQHPNADKLHVLRVFNGKEDVQIVCGAPNVRVGMKSILAQPGCYVLKFNETIEISKLRGVESRGMMCAEDELGIGDDHEGIIDLNTDLPAGTPAAEALNADIIFDVNVTPNRPDCLGVKGIARDLSATGIGTLTETPVATVAGKFDSPVTVEIQDKACPIYTGRFIKNVKNGESPDWMKRALIAAGLRPISALVDITNYLNIAECRPLHVFDADKLSGKIIVRPAKENEKLMALDDREYTLSPEICVVADERAAQSIAGVMGGVDTAVSRETKNVFLESAYFEPVAIAKAGVLTNAVSDSRSRFERGVDPLSTIPDNERATQMILDLCGGEASNIVIAGKEPDCTRVIDFDFHEVKRLTGLEIPQEKMVEILNRLGFGVSGTQITVPSWRIHDVSLSADLVEEIVRIYGLDELPDAPMRAETLPIGTLLPKQKKEVAVRRALASRGLCQAITWSFMDSRLAKYFGSHGVKLANPIASDLDEMRPSLIPNLLSAVKRNQDHGTQDVQLFEVGPEFYSDKPGEQRLVACGVRAGNFTPKHWLSVGRTVDVFDAKADALAALASVDAPQNTQILKNAPSWYHPGRSGSIQLGKNILAVFGEIHPAILKVFDIKTPVCAFELYLDAVPTGKAKGKLQKELKASNLMPLTRDFAFVMDENVEAVKVISTIQNVSKELITEVSVFDVYQGEHLPEGKKSLAIKVTIQPQDKTLTDADIEALSAQIINFVAKNTGAVLRA